jgi:hypothetical protein
MNYKTKERIIKMIIYTIIGFAIVFLLAPDERKIIIEKDANN